VDLDAGMAHRTDGNRQGDALQLIFIAQPLDEAPDRLALAIGFIKIGFQQDPRPIGESLLQRGFGRLAVAVEQITPVAESIKLALDRGDSILLPEDSHGFLLIECGVGAPPGKGRINQAARP
jgi:hypothetical protein